MTARKIENLVLLLLVFTNACREHEKTSPLQTNIPVMNIDSLHFPLLIDNGKKVVYEFTKMTPRGPRVFLDTVDYNPKQVALDSLQAKFLFPITLSEEERNASPGMVAISIPGFWQEAIFGLIDEQDRLKVNYKDTEYVLNSRDKLNVKAGDFNATFINDSIVIELTISLSETPTQTHFSGSGKMKIREANHITQESDVFMVLMKR